jgi:hypothetical protein
MTSQQIAEAEKLERIEEIATVAKVDTSDPTEPLEELIERIREGLQKQLDNMQDRFEGYQAEMDEIEADLCEQDPEEEDDGNEATKAAGTN